MNISFEGKRILVTGAGQGNTLFFFIFFTITLREKHNHYFVMKLPVENCQIDFYVDFYKNPGKFLGNIDICK